MKSRSFFITISLVIFFNLGLFAQETITFQDGSALSAAGLESPVFVDTQAGSRYVAGIQDGRLAVLRSTDGGLSFAEYPLNINFGQVKDIILYNRFYVTWNLIVVGSDTLFCLAFDEAGEIISEYDWPLKTAGAGEVSRVAVTKGQLDDYIITYLQGGMFVTVHVNPETENIFNTEIAGFDERVTDYYIENTAGEDTGIIYKGYYTAEIAGGDKNLFYYEIDNTNAVITAAITNRFGGAEDISILRTVDDGIGLVCKEGNTARYYFQNEGLWELFQEIEFPFANYEVKTFTDRAAYRHIINGDGIGYFDVDGTPAFDTPFQVADFPIQGMPKTFSNTDGSFFGVIFIEDSNPPALHVRELAIDRNAGLILDISGSLPFDSPGDMKGCIYLQEDNYYLAAFDVTGTSEVHLGNTDGNGNFIWTGLGEYSGTFPDGPPDAEALVSGDTYSVYTLGSALFVFNKENPAASLFYSNAVFVPYSYEDNQGIGIIDRTSTENTLVLIASEVR